MIITFNKEHGKFHINIKYVDYGTNGGQHGEKDYLIEGTDFKNELRRLLKESNGVRKISIEDLEQEQEKFVKEALKELEVNICPKCKGTNVKGAQFNLTSLNGPSEKVMSNPLFCYDCNQTLERLKRENHV